MPTISRNFCRCICHSHTYTHKHARENCKKSERKLIVWSQQVAKRKGEKILFLSLPKNRNEHARCHNVPLRICDANQPHLTATQWSRRAEKFVSVSQKFERKRGTLRSDKDDGQLTQRHITVSAHDQSGAQLIEVLSGS